jgi:hypothetical protein
LCLPALEFHSEKEKITKINFKTKEKENLRFVMFQRREKKNLTYPLRRIHFHRNKISHQLFKNINNFNIIIHQNFINQITSMVNSLSFSSFSSLTKFRLASPKCQRFKQEFEVIESDLQKVKRDMKFQRTTMKEFFDSKEK